VCAAYLWMRPRIADRLIALLGALVGLAMVLMKFVPLVPGHFSGWEWLVLVLWIILGTLIGRPRRKQLTMGETAEERNS
ncbi:MAG TPA: hypothetical protein VKI40_03860, partial [Terriglobales bacterium]|nr:hypothetical protein [Terriglobales bacterium]